MAQHTCEFPTGCKTKNGVRLIEVTTALGRTRYWCCRAHIALMRDHPERIQTLLKQGMTAWNATGATITPKELHEHPAQQALKHHQSICDTCKTVRDYIAAECLNGHVQTKADVDDIGRYVIAHSCPEGVRLNYQVGLAMKSAA